MIVLLLLLLNGAVTPGVLGTRDLSGLQGGTIKRGEF